MVPGLPPGTGTIHPAPGPSLQPRLASNQPIGTGQKAGRRRSRPHRAIDRLQYVPSVTLRFMIDDLRLPKEKGPDAGLSLARDRQPSAIWRSLDELAPTAAFKKIASDEFPPGTSELD